MVMSMIKPGNRERQALPPQMEGELRELVRRGLPSPEVVSETGDAETGVNNLTSLIQRVSDSSALEIEKLIAELQTFRTYLQEQAQRVHREITDYAQMSQAAAKSTRIIAESLVQWKEAADNSHRARATRSN
jgi:hypothetical protein